jgi:hypothetical protein
MSLWGIDLKIVGIDLGKKGYCALYDTDYRDTPTTFPLPLDHNEELDAHQLLTLLLDADVKAAVMEKVFKPNVLVRMYGEVVAVCKVLQMEVIERVAVVTWKKAVLGQNTSDKEVSIAKCEELFPKLDLTLPPSNRKRKKTKNDDKAEAALLAKWLADKLTN